ncbi:MAG: alpha/beta hydrolase family protein [Candidatus Thorarchaeota archaeon]
MAYLKGTPNLKTNSLDIEGYIYDIKSKTTHMYSKGSRSIKWLDDNTLCSLKTVQPSGNAQIHMYRDLIGEPIQITNHPSAIQSYEPFADGFVFVASKDNPNLKSRIGEFNHVESEEPNSGLFYVSTERALKNQEQFVSCFKEEKVEDTPSFFEITKILDESFVIDSYVISEAENVVYINCLSKSDLFYSDDTTCYRIEFDPETILDELEKTTIEDALSSMKLTRLAFPKSYKVKEVSPNGDKLILTGRDVNSIPIARHDLWLLDISNLKEELSQSGLKTDMICLTEKIDRYPLDVYWTDQGIYMLHWNESRCYISRIEETGEYETYSLGDIHPEHSFAMNKSGHIAFPGLSPTSLIETYYCKPNGHGWEITRLTNETENFVHLDFGTVESIKWTSKDGTEIEGILRKPSDFDPKKKYPLMIFPHGGPRASSHLSLIVNDYFRPAHSLLARGILILQPNYRGGLGKGREFMELNHDNLGVGDLWDIESGIDYLIEQGYIDESRIGSMGGSQGGYLSAYAGMHTDRFAAVSTHSGVSSWYLYYISSDMRNEFHIEGSPHEPENRDKYWNSAPISAIDRAKTPMLIQHGENDERISVVSSKELYRALKHKGVPTEFFVYPNKGHGFLTPRENYAVMLQAYRWFCHYLLGDELDLFKDDF